MVQVFDFSPVESNASLIGKALGQGFARNFVPPEQRVAQQQLSKAFDNFRANTKPDSSPLDLTMNFLQSIAGIPGSERYAAQVLPLILTQSKGQRGATLENVNGQNPLGNVPSNQPVESNTPQSSAPRREVTGTPTQQFYQKLQSEAPNFPPPQEEQPNLFAGTLEPAQLGMGPIPKLYSPQQIQQFETEDMLAGFPESIRAQRAQQYNELARKEMQDYVQAAQTQSAISEQRRVSQEAFRNILKTYTGKDNLTLSLAENIANKPEYQNIANDNIRAEKVMREVQLLDKNLNNFKNSSARPNPYLPWTRSQYLNNFDVLRDNAKPLIDNGLRPQIQKALTDSGWTTTETEQILNPLGKKIISETTSLPRLQTTYATFDEREKNIRDNQNKKWESFFEKTIKPGEINPKTRDTIKPGTSLFLLRNEYMKKGGNWEEFRDIIQNLRSSGKINLDRFQEDEMNKIIERPFSNLTIEEFFNGTKSL